MGSRPEQVTALIAVGGLKVAIMLGRVNSTRASMARIKTGILSEMNVLKTTLAKHNEGRTVGWKALGRNLERVLEQWNKYDDLYESAIALADGIEIDADKQAHMSFQSDLYSLRDQIQEIVDAGREASETLKNDQTKESRLKQLGDKFDAAYNRVDTTLAEMKIGLSDAKKRCSHLICSTTKAID